MHSCLLLITKEFPTQEVVDKALEPYNEENKDIPYPVITWDWYSIGGRYDGALKLKIDYDNEKYRWQFYSSGGRNGKLFLSKLLSDMGEYASRCGDKFFSEENYYDAMGFRDGYLNVSGAFIDDLIEFENVDCYCCIDKDGKAYTREYWNGNNFETNDKFDEQLSQIKADSKGCYATIIDIHD